jgi:prepilin-type processing-associated H-X9-DG protein
MYLSFNTVEINGDSVRLNYDWGNRQFPLSSIKYAGSAPGEDKPPVRGRYETLVLEIRTVDGSVYRSQKISACDWDAPRYVIDEFNEFCRKKRIHRVPIPVQRRNCTRNLREIGLELREYADLHKNQYPASGNSSDEIFRSLGDYLQEEGWLRCPSEGGKSRQSYCYAIPNPNLFTNSTAIPENFPLAMDRGLSPTNVALSALVGKKWSESSPHGGKGGNVLFAGGHVKWCLEFDSTFDTNGFLLVPR